MLTLITEGSNDEGIHISRSRGLPIGDIARSLPVNMPKFPMERPAVREIDDYVILFLLYCFWGRQKISLILKYFVSSFCILFKMLRFE